MEENKDVDLYEELNKALAHESSVEETDGASTEKPTEEVTTSDPLKDDNGEMSEDEISKLSPRAQKRIRDLASQVKELAEKPAEKSPVESPETEDEPAQEFKNVQDFLSAVQDEPSRNLLEKFYQTIKGEMKETLSPIEQANNKAKFENEFSIYADKIEGLADYKSDLQKTFLRNPNQSLKSLISDVALDLQLNRVKPIEKTPSSPNRSGTVNLDNASKDELYAQLEAMR